MSLFMFLALLFGSLAVILPTQSLRCHKKKCSNGNCPEEGEKDCEDGDFNRCRKISYVVGTDPSSTFEGMDCANSVMDCNSEIVCESVKRKLKQRRLTVSNCRVFCCDGDLCNGPEEECVSLQDGIQSFNDDIETVPIKWFETPSVVSLEPECTGEEALGLESGLVTDQQMSASSSWDKNHGPENARLNIAAARGKTGAWSSKTNDRDQYLQVDFWRDVKITKFQTQGRQDNDQWVTRYTLSYCANGSSTFQTYQENGVNKVFTGNADRNSIVTHVLRQPTVARYVQIKVLDFHRHISMRAEFFGCVLSDRYQVIGRNVHINSVKEHLKKKQKINFNYRQDWSNNIQLEILADTIYVEGDIKLHGIKNLTMYGRKASFARESRLDLRAPDLLQDFKTLSAGEDGDDGKHGVHGPVVEIFADKIEGYVNIQTSAGNGKQGQNGADGIDGTDSEDEKLPISNLECWERALRDRRGQVIGCIQEITGLPGEQGGDGTDGGYAGNSGNGGDAGNQTIHVRRVRGKMELITCRGTGGRAAINGLGGVGGEGGLAGHGIKCSYRRSCFPRMCPPTCAPNGYLEEDDDLALGPPGRNGKNGQTLIRAGSNGQVEGSYLQKLDLTPSAKQKYPLALIKLLTRYAEDLIWVNKVTEAEEVLNFTVTLTKERSEASELRKAAKRRLAFLNKKGFDRFGRNLLFAPLMKWEAFKEQVESIRDHAREYEDAYNGIQASVERQDGIKEILEALPQAAKIQVDKELERLQEARRVAISEKRAYVSGIKDLEKKMTRFLEDVVHLLPEAHGKTQLGKSDLLVVLGGITGIGSSVIAKDPFAAVSAVVGVADHLQSKCDPGTLLDNLEKIKHWLTFGQAYAALEDSSDLNFDEVDVESIPEIMEANLEMNSQALANDLVCLLGSGPPITFEERIEQFFIAGGARINLIGKVLDLDNFIGGCNFDIANLQETSNTLESLGQVGDSPIADRIQKTFLDDLLTSYEQIQTSFTNHLYQFYKGFEFRSLWNVNDRLEHFQQIAREAAQGTGRLQGVLQLTNALQEIDNFQNIGRQCFTRFRYSTNTHKWTFDSIQNPAMFTQLHQGNATFLLNISDSCDTCYNVRLLKMYVELYGDTTKDESDFPPMVHLKVRRMGDSYFRDGIGHIREFRQPLASWRTFQFNRFAITDREECNEEKKKGVSDSLFCMEQDDVRFQPMCCHYLSDSPCEDVLLGAEECTSPFGTYEISIPIDDTVPCQASSSRITHKNCRDFDRSIYTKMNVWIHYLYWADGYPTGPDDLRCRNFQTPSSKSQVPLSKPAITHRA